MSIRAALAAEHLQLHLRPINRALEIAVARQAAETSLLDRPDLTPICITDRHVQILLGRVDALTYPAQDWPPSSSCSNPRPVGAPSPVWASAVDEAAAEQALQEQAAAHGVGLPLVELVETLDLTTSELWAILLCAAPEVDRAYERIFAYILDDLDRRLPCVELLCALTADSAAERLHRRQEMGPFGRLRLLGLLRPVGEASLDLRQELRLAPGVFDFLLGHGGDLGLLAHDPAEVTIPLDATLASHPDATEIQSLGTALGDGRLDLVGVWGETRDRQAEVVMELARVAGKRLRKLVMPGLSGEQPGQLDRTQLRGAIQAAALPEAMLWVAADSLDEPASKESEEILSEALVRSKVPVCLSGAHPWRPAKLLAARSYAEMKVRSPGYRERRAMWSAALPDVGEQHVGDLAARYRMGKDHMQAAISMARMDAALRSNGHGSCLAERLNSAAAAVVRRRSYQFATMITPRRTAQDLILPPALHQRVLEIAAFFRSWPEISETWGFSRQAPGIKALFTGEPGTGKTLAAEVTASILGLTLLKVDLARVVSKWIGETEKNLEAAFQEAADSHCVLFFDEADALFGKRGEVRHGTDRYANLEIGYLLQRLEEHDGLVILASNLRENIDSAFTRRFHFVIHFPRPERQERERMWTAAFPPRALLADDVDIDMLADLDMTGAGIVGAARTAALLTADEGLPAITMANLVRAVSRQFHQESRLLCSEDFGRYSQFLREGHGAEKDVRNETA